MIRFPGLFTERKEIKKVDINECYAPVDFLALGNTENDAEATFFNGPINKSSVEKIIFVNNTNVPTDAIGSWNASASGEGKVIAWYKDEDSNSLYEVYIGGTQIGKWTEKGFGEQKEKIRWNRIRKNCSLSR